MGSYRLIPPIFHHSLLWPLGIVLAAILGCQPTPSETLDIGLIAPLSGDSVGVGESTEQGARLAVDEINQAGGILISGQSHPINLVIEDNQDEVDIAVEKARKLIFQDEVIAIIGPQLSRNAIPVAKFVETYKVPMISPRSTNPAPTASKRYVFRSIFIDPFQGQVMAEFARQQLQAQRAAVLFDVASAYNRDIAQVFKQVFEQSGGQVVAFESYTTGTQDYSTQISVIQQSNPDVLFLPNYDHELPQQIQQLRAAGIEAQLLGSDAWGGLVDIQPALTEGAFFSDQYAPDSQSPKVRQFIDAYEAAYGVSPDSVAASTYDTVYILQQAILKADQTEPEAIRDSLASLGNYNGVTGSFTFRGTGDPVRSVMILQFHNGRPIFYDQVDPNPSPTSPTPQSSNLLSIFASKLPTTAW
ncbi:ethanolamine utilization protein EutJ [filamentous cyanobacterium CCP5]|nr:ethanolamine utilization protein EutJ [filamentous cyanobacterium CCP5]